jgi:hypothetical protein
MTNTYHYQVIQAMLWLGIKSDFIFGRTMMLITNGTTLQQGRGN